MQDYYKILGIKPNATYSEIRNAFRNLARKYHPDINKSKSAKDKFIEINDAYEFLSNAENRRALDIFLTNEKNLSFSEKLQPVVKFFKFFVSGLKIFLFGILGFILSFVISRFIFDFSFLHQIIFSITGFLFFAIFTFDFEFFAREIFSYYGYIIFFYIRSFIFSSYIFIFSFKFVEFFMPKIFGNDSFIANSIWSKLVPAIFLMALGAILPKNENYTCLFCEQNIKKIAKNYIKCFSLAIRVGIFFGFFYYFGLINLSQMELIIFGAFIGSMVLQSRPND
ncbi:MAG: hypothetical protein Fur0024_0130 [Patescibacteria group bacterium]